MSLSRRQNFYVNELIDGNSLAAHSTSSSNMMVMGSASAHLSQSKPLEDWLPRRHPSVGHNASKASISHAETPASTSGKDAGESTSRRASVKQKDVDRSTPEKGSPVSPTPKRRATVASSGDTSRHNSQPKSQSSSPRRNTIPDPFGSPTATKTRHRTVGIIEEPSFSPKRYHNPKLAHVASRFMNAFKIASPTVRKVKEAPTPHYRMAIHNVKPELAYQAPLSPLYHVTSPDSNPISPPPRGFHPSLGLKGSGKSPRWQKPFISPLLRVTSLLSPNRRSSSGPEN